MGAAGLLRVTDGVATGGAESSALEQPAVAAANARTANRDVRFLRIG